MPSGKAALDWKRRTRKKGVSVSFDAPKKYGGEETALAPIKTLASLTAYSSHDVLSILKKKRQKVTDYHVGTTAERGEDPPSNAFTSIRLKCIVKGGNVA